MGKVASLSFEIESCQCLYHRMNFIHSELPMSKPVPLGTTAQATLVVENKHTLNGLDKRLPPVLTTPHMIGWMEHACFLATEPFHDDGEITVGTAIHVNHRAPTGI